VTVDLDKLVNLSESVAAHAKPRAGRTATGQSWYTIRNASPKFAEVFIYEEIGMWGVSAKDFVAELRGLKADQIELHINSNGGAVFDGVAIYNALINHPARIVSIVDGIAASAASFIAMAGEEIEIEKTGRMMIHEASGVAMGNAADLRELADLLDGLSDTIAEIYADRAGGTVQEWRDRMLATTWYTASEAVEAGLANRVAGDIPPDPEDKILTNDLPEEDPVLLSDLSEFQQLMREAFSS
jgi:ATP-dependent protease ClpP protease subunit